LHFWNGSVERCHTHPAALIEIWRDVLELAEVNVNDNFFELGGHSLMETRAIARIHHVFQIESPMRTFFEAPTILAILKVIEDIIWFWRAPLGGRLGFITVTTRRSIGGVFCSLTSAVITHLPRYTSANTIYPSIMASRVFKFWVASVQSRSAGDVLEPNKLRR
jgi:hypothetical protein